MRIVVLGLRGFPNIQGGVETCDLRERYRAIQPNDWVAAES